MWAPAIKLRLESLVACTFTCLAIYQPLTFFTVLCFCLVLFFNLFIWSWKDGMAANSTYYSCRGPRVQFLAHGGSQTPLTEMSGLHHHTQLFGYVCADDPNSQSHILHGKHLMHRGIPQSL